MPTNYTMDWSSASQFAPNLQLEEYYLSTSGQPRPHPTPLMHTASYPPATQDHYRNISQGSVGQQPARSHSLGQNGNVYVPSTSGIYEPSMSQAQPAAAYNTSSNVNGFYTPLPHRQYQPEPIQISTSPGLGTGLGLSDALSINGTSDGGLTPPFVSSPMSVPMGFGDAPQTQRQGQTQYHTQQIFHFRSDAASESNTNLGDLAHGPQPVHQGKRQRGLDEDNESDNVGMEHEHDDSAGQDNKDAKPKPLGACARCKLLKVKCEFKTTEDPCKRCMNAGKECFIPGRKKRRTPPKREHLLTQIREQATQIQQLIAQLEATKRQPQPRVRTLSSGRRSSPGADLLSPIDSTLSDSSDSSPKPDVEEWIAKARESFEAFGEFIGAGGVEMTKKFLVDEDPENSGGSDDDNYEFALEDDEGETTPIDELFAERSSSDHDGEQMGISTASVSGVNGGPVPVPKKKSSNGSEKLVILPGEAAPFGLIASLSLKARKRRGSDVTADDDDDVGVASGDFFRSPSPDSARSRMLNDPKQTPHILARGIITPDEAEKLFKIYFNNINLSVSLLDPVLYTAQKTCYRSPFLFTVICAIASRYYAEKPELYNNLMHYAQLAAGTALISGQKSVEVCQAYILLSLYPVPARRWEDDRSWLYLGLAIRVATDLNLHLPNTAKPVNEHHAREMLNRTRVWMNCFNLDRSTGSQYGKMPIIDNSDYIACHSEGWWNSSDVNISNIDVHLCCYNAELRLMAEFRKKIYSDPHHPTGLNKDVDFERIATETDEELKSLGDRWFSRIEQMDDQTDPQYRFRTGLLKLAYSYARLVALSMGFQHAFGKSNTDENPFLTRCLSAASDVVNTYVNDVGRPSQRIYLRHGPEAQSVFVTFACSFLVKLLQPKFTFYFTREKRLEIRGLVQSVADLLGSPEVAIDDRHGPKLYSRFLKGLLATPMARVDTHSPSGMSQGLPHRRSGRKHKSPSGHSPRSERSLELASANGSTQTSPSTSRLVLSPLTDSTLDTFAPTTGISPSLTIQDQFSNRTSPSNQVQYATATDMNEWFGTPLPFDSELLQSMHSVQDSVWGGQAVSLPGFNWLSNIQPGSEDTYMSHTDGMNELFPDYFNIKTPPP